MLQLLSWLWQQAGKVFEWFGGPFWSLYRRLTDFFSILWGQIHQALYPVYGTIWQGLGDLWNRTTGFVGSVIGNVTNYAVNLFGIVRNEVNGVGARVELYRAQGKSYIDAVTLALRDTLLAIFNSFVGQTQLLWIAIWKEWQQYQTFLGRWVLAMINTSILPVTSWIQQQLESVREFIRKVEALAATVRMLVAYFTGRAQSIITTFVRDPVGFVVAALIGRLLDILFQLLAEALGAVNDTIPERPDWGLDLYDMVENGAVIGRNPGTGLPYSPDDPFGTGSGRLPVGSGGFVRPLSSVRVSGYRFAADHPGVDLGLSMGTPVYAAHDGVVRTTTVGYTGYGINVTLEGGIYWTRYAHLQGFVVSVGQQVRAGQLIGYGDSTGNSSGPHLHFEVRVNGRYIDPLTLL